MNKDNETIQLSKRGYMLMPNKILEALITRDFTKRQLKILLLILRMSLGCQLFAMKYENRYFRLCGLYRNSIPTELNELEKLKVIRIDREKKWIAFNFLVAEWAVVQIGNMDSEKVSKLVKGVVSKQISEQSVSMTPSLHLPNELEADPDLKYILKIFQKNKIKRYDRERKFREMKENLFRIDR
jgi:phage replication O-like protein O